MSRLNRCALALSLGLALCLALAPGALAQNDAPLPPSEPTEPSMTTRASGTFDVKMNPRTPAEDELDSLARMVLDKSFSGDLEATSQGQMLAFRTPVEGSAGYVAMEVVRGTLQGRRGTFVLQHSGIMNRGEASLTLVVVPDSGTDELEGLSGSMAIVIEEGKHLYEFDYTLPESL
jgi:Protein of unknown function (DUF3224)